MLVFWGRRNRYPGVGYAAMFCPFCREIREARVREMRSVFFFLFLPFGLGKLVAYRLDCRECGAHQIVPELPAGNLMKRPARSVEESIARTRPGLREEMAGRLEVERKIREGRAPVDQRSREALLLEPFEAAASEMEVGCSETRVDLPGVLGCFGTLVGMVFAAAIADQLVELLADGQSAVDWPLWAIFVAATLGCAVTLWLLFSAPRRWLERRIAPHINRALKPIAPTRGEIEQIIAAYRAEGLRFGRALRVKAFSFREDD